MTDRCATCLRHLGDWSHAEGCECSECVRSCWGNCERVAMRRLAEAMELLRWCHENVDTYEYFDRIKAFLNSEPPKASVNNGEHIVTSYARQLGLLGKKDGGSHD